MAKRVAAAVVDPTDVASFSTLVACLEGGKFDEDLTNALRALISRMKRDHGAGGGKPTGKISLTISLRLEDGTIATTQAFGVDPSVTRTPDRFFLSEGGSLSHQSPQAVIPLKGVVR